MCGVHMAMLNSDSHRCRSFIHTLYDTGAPVFFLWTSNSHCATDILHAEEPLGRKPPALVWLGGFGEKPVFLVQPWCAQCIVIMAIMDFSTHAYLADMPHYNTCLYSSNELNAVLVQPGLLMISCPACKKVEAKCQIYELYKGTRWHLPPHL